MKNIIFQTNLILIAGNNDYLYFVLKLWLAPFYNLIQRNGNYRNINIHSKTFLKRKLNKFETIRVLIFIHKTETSNVNI